VKTTHLGRWLCGGRHPETDGFPRRGIDTSASRPPSLRPTTEMAKAPKEPLWGVDKGEQDNAYSEQSYAD
jgi:hypothetical protein